MHKLIFIEFKRYMAAQYDETILHKVSKQFEDRYSHSEEIQPDEDFYALVSILARDSAKTTSEVLESFGCFIAPRLVEYARVLLTTRTRWKTLDYVERTEEAIHKMLRKQTTMDPPHLAFNRLNEKELEVIYVSQRRLCHFGKGIIRGIADQHQEYVNITDITCMLEGAESCRFLVQSIE